ncbi:MAG: hypothetical protein N4A59_11960 [Marinifilum sp.]|jgi:hypothetical protein|nr:hypothetical protein [Marinifilum sp.]
MKRICIFILFQIGSIYGFTQNNEYPNSGDVKIYNYSPKLILQRNTQTGGFIQGIQTKMFDGTDNWYFGAHQTHSWVVSKGNYQGILFTVRENGNVGIGTNNPTAKLDVTGEVKTNNGRLVIRDNSLEEWKTDGISQLAVNYYGYNKGTSQFRDFAIYNGKANRIMFVDGSTGNIGIGTSPSVKLDVNGEVRTNGGRLVMRDNSLEEWATNGKTGIAVNYYGYQRGNKQFRDFTVYNGKSEGILYVEGETKSVGIGTATTGTHKLAVNGTIGAREIKVEASAWSDFVFEDNYQLKDLEEVESYIEENKHLPDVPSEKEVLENGIQLGEMDAKLLQKIEELTLYLINQNKQLMKQSNEIQQLKTEIKKLKK